MILSERNGFAAVTHQLRPAPVVAVWHLSQAKAACTTFAVLANRHVR
jgi:hypothetical protein